MTTHYYLVHGDGPMTMVTKLNTSDFIVPVDEFNGGKPSFDELVNAADNPGLTVIPLIEELEQIERELEPHTHDKCGRTCYGS